MHTNLIDLIRPQMQMQIYQILPRIFYNYKMVKQFVSLSQMSTGEEVGETNSMRINICF